MEISEIKALYDELTIRGLKAILKERMRIYRPTLTYDTIDAAFEIQDFENAKPLYRRILQEAKSILQQDDKRISLLSQEQVATT